MACRHGRDEYTCILCSQEKTHGMIAKNTEIAERAAAEQSAFIAEQRQKENVRESAETIKAHMRHEYLKLVREGKNKMVDLGNGEIKLDNADIELYWAEYRENQFAQIEDHRTQLTQHYHQLRRDSVETIFRIVRTMLGPNIAIGIAAGLIFMMSVFSASNNASFGTTIFALILVFGGGLAWTLKQQGMPASQEEWIPPLLTAAPFGVLGLALGLGSFTGIVLSGGLIFVSKKIRARAVRNNPEVIQLNNLIAQTEAQLNDLLSSDVMSAIRRLG